MQDEETTGEENNKSVSRRHFIKGAALTAAAFTIVPRHVIGGPGFTAPSDKVNIAGVGVGGMGRANLLNLSTQNIVALCDIDWDYTKKAYDRLDADTERAQARLKDAKNEEERKSIGDQAENFKRLKEQYTKAKQYKDYRQMLDKQKDIDAVVIATPDHTHAVIALAAMKMGKHVYVQKPLTYTVHESRVLADEARKAKVITQMGNQGHSSDDARKINEWIADGAIGKVREVHVWTNRPIWPQGISRPQDSPAVPDTLDWELFLGPAPYRPYNPAYTPFKWRGWVDYGVSALGDMGAHLIDHPNWALKLGAPVSIEATSTPFGKSKDASGKDILETYPLASVVHYEFAARGDMPAVKMIWYDGGLMPPRPEEMEPTENIDKGGGVLFIGEKGKLMHGTYGANPRLLPKSKMESYKQPKPTIARVTTSHEMDWVNGIKNNKQPSSNFDYAGPLTETMLLGVVATMVPGKKLLWDGPAMKITNVPEANEYIRRQYRQGWALM
jgi:predicted dehydrogenase